MTSIYDWSTTAASNDSVGSINWQEGQLPATVNNSARAEMADVAAWRDLLGGVKVSATADTMTLTSGMSLSAYAQGMMFAFECGAANTGAVTINVDSIGAKAIVKRYNVPLVSGDLVAGGIYLIAYEASADNFQLLSLPSAVEPSYETGTFTPVIQEAGSTVGDAAYNASFTAGTYTKIGRLVHFSATIRLTSKGTVTSTSVVTVGGLPYASDSTIGFRAACSCYVHSGVSMSGTTNGFFGAIIDQNTDYIKFRVADLSSDTQEDVQMADITDSLYLQVTGSYQTT